MFKAFPVARVAVPCFIIAYILGLLSGMFIWRGSSTGETAPDQNVDTLAKGVHPKPNEHSRVDGPPKEYSQHYPEGFGLPSQGKSIERRSYVASINYFTRTPAWVAEKLTAHQLEAKKAVKGKFLEDQDVPRRHRAQDSDYKNSRWSRGHLAASASHLHDQAAQDDTFLLSSNIVPQDRSMNGCDWNRLEVLVRELVMKYRTGAVYVVSGPMWISEAQTTFSQRPFTDNRVIMHDVIGANEVHVPTHIFKIIKVVAPNFEATAAFAMPNRPIPHELPLNHYLVQISYIERLTGLDFIGMVTNTDLCKKTQCDRPSDKSMQAWRHFGIIDETTTVPAFRDATRNAYNAGFIEKRYPYVAEVIRDRAIELGITVSMLFSQEPHIERAITAVLPK